MPTIYRDLGFRVFFFSNESHEPPHIHVEKGAAQAKIWLNPAQLSWSHGFNRSELRQLRQIVGEHEKQFLEAWHEYFS